MTILLLLGWGPPFEAVRKRRVGPLMLLLAPQDHLVSVSGHH